MKLDPATSLRILNNQRLMRATHRGEYRDLGGALALTSDAPPVEWNFLEAFTTDEHRLEGLLDIGFSLLRAFDRAPAVRLTPFDRPVRIDAALERRGLVAIERETSMVFRGDAGAIDVNGSVEVRRATPDDAGVYADVESSARPSSKWLRPFLLGATLANIIDGDRAFYIAYLGGDAVGIALVVYDGATAGISAVATLKTQRRQGVATAMTARAILDAQAAGADLICLECVSGSDAMRLYASMGFAPVHESTLWSERG